MEKANIYSYKVVVGRRPVKRLGMEFYHHIVSEFVNGGGILLAGTDSGIEGLLHGVDLMHL